jgi:hypothetical protein
MQPTTSVSLSNQHVIRLIDLWRKIDWFPGEEETRLYFAAGGKGKGYVGKHGELIDCSICRSNKPAQRLP